MELTNANSRFLGKCSDFLRFLGKRSAGRLGVKCAQSSWPNYLVDYELLLFKGRPPPGGGSKTFRVFRINLAAGSSRCLPTEGRAPTAEQLAPPLPSLLEKAREKVPRDLAMLLIPPPSCHCRVPRVPRTSRFLIRERTLSLSLSFSFSSSVVQEEVIRH